MNKEQWREKRAFSDKVSTESLKSVINDYETKLCEMHSKILVLESDKEQLIEANRRDSDIKKTLLDVAQRDTKKYNDWWLSEINKTREQRELLEKYKRRTKRLIELVRSKWWVRGKLLKVLIEEIK